MPQNPTLTLTLYEKDDPFWINKDMFEFLHKWAKYINSPQLQEDNRKMREHILDIEQNGVPVTEIQLYDGNGNLIRTEYPEDCRLFPPKLTVDFKYDPTVEK